MTEARRLSKGLDLAPLVSAVARLVEGLRRHRREPADEQLRDGLIQRLEYTYELCHRFPRRFIRLAATSEEIDRLAFQDLIRTANQQGFLLGNWPAWHRFRDLRARSSHTYRAEAVAAAMPPFLTETEYLRDQLQTRLKQAEGRISLRPAW